jgi:ribosomal subunit interface protein
MKIEVSGKGVAIGESLKTHVEQHVEETITKYIDRVTSVHVVVAKEAHRFRVDIHGALGTHAGLVVKSSALGDDVYATFDAALEKVGKQLRRYKRKITNHHKQSMGGAEVDFAGTKYVLPSDVGEHEDDSKVSSLVIAEKPETVEHLSVSQAVMKMDLLDLPALLFFNAAHGRINVVYRRVDGNISWVDPGKAA